MMSDSFTTNPEAHDIEQSIAKNRDILTDKNVPIEQKIDLLQKSTVLPAVIDAQKYPEYRAVLEKIAQTGNVTLESITEAIRTTVDSSSNNTDAIEARAFTVKELQTELREAYKSTLKIFVQNKMVGYGFIGNQNGKSALPLRILPKDDDGTVTLHGVEIELSDGTRISLEKDHIEYTGSTTAQLTPEGLRNRPLKQSYIRMAEGTKPNEVLYILHEHGATPVRSSDNGTIILNDNSDGMQRVNIHAELDGGPIVNSKGELVAFYEGNTQIQSIDNGKLSAVVKSNTATKNELQRLNEDVVDAQLLN